MSRWFRFYDCALDDPKVQRLSPPLFKAWINLLCVASRSGGNVPCNDDVTFHLRCTKREAEEIVTELVSVGLLDKTEDGYRPHNWDSRQFVSDTSNQRVREHRKRKRNVTVTADATPPETDTDTETDNKKGPADAAPVGGSPPTIDLRAEMDRKRLSEDRAKLRLIGEQWNAIAAELGLPQIEEIEAGSAREKSAFARIREGRDFDRVFAKIRGSPFLRGDKGRSPCAFDWITNPTNFVKIVEGNYDEVREAKAGNPNSYGSAVRR